MVSLIINLMVYAAKLYGSYCFCAPIWYHLAILLLSYSTSLRGMDSRLLLAPRSTGFRNKNAKRALDPDRLENQSRFFSLLLFVKRRIEFSRGILGGKVLF